MMSSRKSLGYGLGGLLVASLLIVAFMPQPDAKEISGLFRGFAGTDEQLNYAPPGQGEQPDAYQKEVRRQALELRKSLSLREKIAQLLVVRASGSYYARDDAEFRRLSRLVQEHQVGGIIFFRGDVYNQAILYNKLQEKASIPLWISQDMEFGAAMRIQGTTRITPAMGIAATGNPQWAYEKGRITAAEARAIGVHQIYAPVVDVNNNPDNPVINRRSYSEDPETVGRFATAFIQGAQAEGVLATAKHFPGHGDTDLDSHTALPIINKSYEELLEIELQPFQDVIDAGVHSVMSAHIAFPAIAGSAGRPATLDARLLHGMLRDSLGFQGMIVTDGLEMQGIAGHYAPHEAAVLALQAGVDVLLLSPDELSVIDGVEQAVRRGELSEQRIDRSVDLMLQWKIGRGLMEQPLVDISAISAVVGQREHQLMAREMAQESITLAKNEGGILPIQPERFPRISVIAIANSESGQVGGSFRAALNRYHPSVSFHLYDDRTSDRELEQALASAQRSDLVILGSFLPLSTGSPLSFSRDQRRFVNRLEALDKPSVLISFSTPYVLAEMPDADVHLLSWTSLGEHSEATAAALFGASKVGGRLPISLPGLYERGDGLDLPQTILRQELPEAAGLSSEKLHEVRRIMEEAVQDSVFPGGVVSIVRQGKMVFNEGFGYHDYQKQQAVRSSDIYDLASLTKPLATTAATMMLLERGQLSLDTPVAKYFEEFSVDSTRSAITIRHLLNHTSGLPAFRNYVDELKTRDEILRAIRLEPLINTPGETLVYSDLGFILLAEIVAEEAGMSFDAFLNQQLYYPLGMTETVFKPERRGWRTLRRIPPTEIDATYRNRVIQGQVHDERAYYMGGVAGHAGLFSTAADVSHFAQMLLWNGKYNNHRFIDSTTVAEFTARRPEGMGRALGFDLKSLEGFTTAGQQASEATYGHLGFTGTSLWIDPERELAVVLLTNRTYPKRQSSAGINQVRNRVMDAVFESILD